MRIKAFSLFIETENLKNHVLKNSTVVVDAQNFFYRLYEKSGLQYIFGCESDKYADYLRNYLSMFKKANVKCYFIFKGGHEHYMRYVSKIKDNEVNVQEFNVNADYEHIVLPIFMKDVYKQILDEMDFDYTICEYEAKKDCIALARKLKCPVISHDIEFCFSGIPYIMSNFKFDEQSNSIKCGIFSLDDFLQKYRLTAEKLALFITLTDENGFPTDHFIDFLMSLRIHVNNYYKRNQGILTWLARTNKENAFSQIFRYINKEDKDKFLELERNNRAFIRRNETMGIPANYLANGNNVVISEKDQFWFQKGVASKHIAIQLINRARFGIFEGSWAIADYTQDDPLLITLDIVKYIYNLLTNFEKERLVLFMKNQQYTVSLSDSISKPTYDGINSPFENGWKHLKGEMFKHFLNEYFHGFDFDAMEKISEDLRMIMIALIYFSVKKSISTRNEVCSILLSYVALNELSKADSNNNDQLTAKCVLKKYLYVSKKEAKIIFDVKLLHPLVEFQHCLQTLNQLNVLCGGLYKPTVYSNTFNATFVYKVLYTINTTYNGDGMMFLIQELNSAPTVIVYIKTLMNVYDEIMDSIL